MENYLKLLKEVYEQGDTKEPAREGMPRTKELFVRQLRFDLQEGFPLLTTKRVFFKGVIHELLWMLKGNTNVGYLVDNNVNIWNQDSYKLYKKQGGLLGYSDWLDCVEQGVEGFGECGRIYGQQWRNFDGKFDQIEHLIESIKTSPNSRYHVVTAWNPSDFFLGEVALPSCHVYFQCNVRCHKYLDLSIVQRSCDMFLGVPFNIAFYGALTHILAEMTGLCPGELIWQGQSVHLYENHFDQVLEQLRRTPSKLPCLKVRRKERVEDYEIEDFMLSGYSPAPSIKGELSVGK